VIYLSGVTSDRDEPALIAHGIGLMCQPGNSYYLRADRYPFTAYDNGCFAGKWVEDEHFAKLEAFPRDRCLFAVSPDVYPDALASLERGLQYAPLIREMGFPVAIVAQDDAERLSWPWDAFDVLFIGGEMRKPAYLEWKMSAGAEELVKEARRHGKWVHMGRVSSLKRMKRARQMGCNSADGTFIKYRRRRRAGEDDTARDARGAAELAEWVAWLDRNRPLFEHETPSLPVHKVAAS
jgi:hypothetical protein